MCVLTGYIDGFIPVENWGCKESAGKPGLSAGQSRGVSPVPSPAECGKWMRRQIPPLRALAGQNSPQPAGTRPRHNPTSRRDHPTSFSAQNHKLQTTNHKLLFEISIMFGYDAITLRLASCRLFDNRIPPSSPWFPPLGRHPCASVFIRVHPWFLPVVFVLPPFRVSCFAFPRCVLRALCVSVVKTPVVHVSTTTLCPHFVRCRRQRTGVHKTVILRATSSVSRKKQHVVLRHFERSPGILHNSLGQIARSPLF